MKRKSLQYVHAALAALGVFLGRGAQADTILDFGIRPVGQANNAAVLQTFGDYVTTSSDGITVSGFGTPNIGLTWQGSPTSSERWDFYLDSIWSAAQLNSSGIGDYHQIVFTPNHASAAVVLKSFKFHGYYLSSERFTYAVSVLDGTNVVSGPVTNTFLSDSTKNHPVSINYTGNIGQTLTLRLLRVASVLQVGETEGNDGNIAVDDITFAQTPETDLSVGPELLGVSPANGAINIAPDYLYLATITNKTTAVVSNSIQLRHNGLLVVPSPTVAVNGDLTTVSYAASGLLASGSTNTYTLIFDDNGVPARSYTNQVSYRVATYINKQLPSPIVFENFDSTSEGVVPAGWTLQSQNLVDPQSEPGVNFTNLDSAAYTNWTVVDVSRFTNAFDVYSEYFNGGTPPASWTTDLQRVLSVSPSNVVNGVFLRNLGTGRMVFANASYRNDTLGQILYLFSPDFNLTGHSNVYLSFHSLWEQNQDSIGAVEYSVDMGATWLPAMYMLERSDIATNLNGSVDSLTTFTNVWGDLAQWVDSGGQTNGSYYGAFIGVSSNLWGTLAPFISARIDDNSVESKRVEILRLPNADNQSHVRLRFAHAGRDSWYWGVDDLGLYSLPVLQITNIVESGGNVTVSWPASTDTWLQKSTSLVPANWQDVSGSLGAGSIMEPAGVQTYYRLARPY